MKKIYIAGKMTGLKNYGKKYFNRMEKNLRKKGWEVINPIKISKYISLMLDKKIKDIPKEIFMKEDLKHLIECDAILLLHNWVNSDGAKIEFAVAKSLGLEIIYEKIIKK